MNQASFSCSAVQGERPSFVVPLGQVVCSMSCQRGPRHSAPNYSRHPGSRDSVPQQSGWRRASSCQSAPAVNCQTDQWADSEEPPASPREVVVTDAEVIDNKAAQIEKDSARIEAAGLPITEKRPSKWDIAQLEQGLALCEDNQTRLAKVSASANQQSAINAI